MQKALYLPKVRITLSDQNPSVQNILIKHLRSLGVPIYEGTNGFDMRFPFLTWKPELNYVTQKSSLLTLIGESGKENTIYVETAEEFLEQFEKPAKPACESFRVGDYDASVFKDKVVVGCQTISRQTVESVLEIMQKLS